MTSAVYAASTVYVACNSHIKSQAAMCGLQVVAYDG